MSWVVQVARELQLSSLAKEYAVLSLDYVLAKTGFTQRQLPLTGATCLLIACKLFCEGDCLSIKDILDSLGGDFSVDDLLDEERRLALILSSAELNAILPSSICDDVAELLGLQSWS